MIPCYTITNSVDPLEGLKEPGKYLNSGSIVNTVLTIANILLFGLTCLSGGTAFLYGFFFYRCEGPSQKKRRNISIYSHVSKNTKFINPVNWPSNRYVDLTNRTWFSDKIAISCRYRWSSEVTWRIRLMALLFDDSTEQGIWKNRCTYKCNYSWDRWQWHH